MLQIHVHCEAIATKIALYLKATTCAAERLNTQSLTAMQLLRSKIYQMLSWIQQYT